MRHLADSIAEIIHPFSTINHFGFVYIRCRSTNNQVLPSRMGDNNDNAMSLSIQLNLDEHRTTLSQLLILPPYIEQNAYQKAQQLQPLKTVPRHIDEERQSININIIHLDSLSRNHFYRSLPRTGDTLRNLQQQTGVSVLDFEMVQSIKARTFESLVALFEGQVETSTPQTFLANEMPPRPIQPEILLQPFRKRGYMTLWMEDTCWRFEWGLVKNLCINTTLSLEQKWVALKQALRKAGIDDIGPSPASCEVLEAYNITHPFHDPPAICFEGRYHHDYLFEYLEGFHETLQNVGKHFFSFYMCNVAHEDTGLRVQTLDDRLSQHLKRVADKHANTLTLVLADHGNTYGPFAEATIEGRIESYHPVMIMMIPEKVASLWGQNKMEALMSNQHKLVSVLDLHKMLYYIGSGSGVTNPNSHPDLGLMSHISSKRTCLDIPRSMPSICICEGLETVVTQQPKHILMAEYAIGMLNNKLHKFSHNSVSCQRLYIANINQISETYTEVSS